MRRTTSLVIAALLALVVIATSSGGAASTGRGKRRAQGIPAPVVLIVFDELPLASLLGESGGVDPSLYPAFADLAAGATWYRNTTTAAAFTSDALPAILTARDPTPRPLPLTRWYPKNVFRWLAPTHEIRTAEDVSFYCGRVACPRQRRSTDLAGSFGHLPAESERGSDVARFLVGLRPAPEPTFHYLHLVFPHAPWRYLPSGQRYPEEGPIPGEVDTVAPGKSWSHDRWVVTQAYQRHLLQTQLVDRLLGRILRRLRTSGMYERSLVAVVADHGIGFLPGTPKRGTGLGDVGGIAYVPMFVKLPFQQEGSISDVPARTIDLVPTILDALDVRSAPRAFHARSLLSGRPREPRILYGEELPGNASPLLATVARKHRLFTDGRPFATAAPDTRGLIGTTTAAWTVAPAAGRASVWLPALENASPDSDVFPALLEGVLRGRSRARRSIVVAVNGRLVAATRSDRRGGFYAMVPPRAFSEPPNDVDLFLYEEGVLVPIVPTARRDERA